MPSNTQSGTLTPTVGTEAQVGTTITTAANTQTKISLQNMVNGDVVAIRMTGKVISGGTECNIGPTLYFANAQGSFIVSLDPDPAVVEYRVYLLQSTGTARPFPWAHVTL